MLKILHKLKWIDWLLIGGFLLIALGVGMSIRENNIASIKTEVVSKENDAVVAKEVKIDIEGEVIKPGVYGLNNGSRISDVLTVAGGLSVNADRNWVDQNLNKAEIVTDGQKIFIPKVGEYINRDEGVLQAHVNGVISLNSAGLSDLDELNGVGPAIAQRIIDYRSQNGGFKNIEEIKLVPGIGDKMYEKIKGQIKL